jgi:hypothetical protein
MKAINIFGAGNLIQITLENIVDKVEQYRQFKVNYINFKGANKFF